MQRFLQVCENEPGAIAVHCKAGLGRTGTNIVAYMIKHWRYTAREATAWIRVCRPGSVVGPQQQYVADVEARLMREGELFRRQRGGAWSPGGPPLPAGHRVPGYDASARGAAAEAEAEHVYNDNNGPTALGGPSVDHAARRRGAFDSYFRVGQGGAHS